LKKLTELRLFFKFYEIIINNNFRGSPICSINGIINALKELKKLELIVLGL